MDAAASDARINFIDQRKIQLDSVIGPIESSESFVKYWRLATGEYAKLLSYTGVFVMTVVLFHEPDGRGLIPISAVNPNIALRYILGFLSDCFPGIANPQRAEEVFDRHRQGRTLFFWHGPEDPAPVSMTSRPR